VNLASAPPAELVEPGGLRPVSLRGETGLTVTPEDFLDRLAPALARWEATFVARGFAPLRAAWLARAARLGQAMRARTGQAEHHGIFETVDASGALVLRTGTGPLAIPAAEVFF
jgi:BirA family biotin operon repressor/biotin-[acetyl-CoA-carboxylase] ligase